MNRTPLSELCYNRNYIKKERVIRWCQEVEPFFIHRSGDNGFLDLNIHHSLKHAIDGVIFDLIHQRYGGSRRLLEVNLALSIAIPGRGWVRRLTGPTMNNVDVGNARRGVRARFWNNQMRAIQRKFFAFQSRIMDRLHIVDESNCALVLSYIPEYIRNR